MTANPPHPPGPGDAGVGERDDADGNALSGGTHGILAVTLATLALALAAAGLAAIIAWVV